LRESCQACDDSSNEKNSHERTDLLHALSPLRPPLASTFGCSWFCKNEIGIEGTGRPGSADHHLLAAPPNERNAIRFLLFSFVEEPNFRLLVSFAAKAELGDSNA
jgi:hypothetical protein